MEVKYFFAICVVKKPFESDAAFNCVLLLLNVQAPPCIRNVATCLTQQNRSSTHTVVKKHTPWFPSEESFEVNASNSQQALVIYS